MRRSTRAGQFGAYEASIFRAICTGTIIGAILFATVTTVVAVAVGVSLAAAIVLGLFTALWGGAGFGGMFGAIVAARRHEAEERAAALTKAAGRSEVPRGHDLAA